MKSEKMSLDSPPYFELNETEKSRPEQPDSELVVVKTRSLKALKTLTVKVLVLLCFLVILAAILAAILVPIYALGNDGDGGKLQSTLLSFLHKTIWY